MVSRRAGADVGAGRIFLDKEGRSPYCTPVRKDLRGNGRTAEGIAVTMKTYQPKASDIDRRWILVDAAGQNLGRLATQVAGLLRGKGKPLFVPHQDVGDFVVVINAEKVAVTGRKIRQKTYYHHSQFPGGIKAVTLGKLLSDAPERVVEKAVRGMLPKTKLGDALFTKLKVYAGPAHPHAAQRPVAMAAAS
jgi:large subunit ribosomal protein L13